MGNGISVLPLIDSSSSLSRARHLYFRRESLAGRCGDTQKLTFEMGELVSASTSDSVTNNKITRLKFGLVTNVESYHFGLFHSDQWSWLGQCLVQLYCGILLQFACPGSAKAHELAFEVISVKKKEKRNKAFSHGFVRAVGNVLF